MRFLRSRLNTMTDGHLSIPQFRIMMYLAEKPRSQSEICAFLAVKPPTLSRMLRGLLARGFVVRSVSDSDARHRLVRLSSKGGKHLNLYRGEVLSELRRRVRHLSTADSVQLKKSLTILQSILQAPHEGVQE